MGWSLPASASERVYNVPVTIDSTGTTDVTDALQNFLRSVPDNSTVAFRPEGRYRSEGTLRLERRNVFTLDGHGATLFATTPGGPKRAHISFVEGSGVSVKN